MHYRNRKWERKKYLVWSSTKDDSSDELLSFDLSQRYFKSIFLSVTHGRITAEFDSNGFFRLGLETNIRGHETEGLRLRA